MTEPHDTLASANRRILVVDDNEAIHGDFGKILCGVQGASGDLDAEAAALFGEEPVIRSQTRFEVEFARQGLEALDLVLQARSEGRPFALAFVDMRMPPGWDGLTTIVELWKADPEIQTVICTAYSDRSWEEIQATLTARERWLVLKKPFDVIEVLQMAHALTEKWSLGRLAATKLEALERMVSARTEDLVHEQRVKHEFLMNASHELLTPMNGICGFLDLLADTPSGTERDEYLSESKKCADQLHGLILRILTFNQAEAGRLVVLVDSFLPSDAVTECLAGYAGAAAAKGLLLRHRIQGDAAAHWIGPSEAIRTTLRLLVDNAIKFTPRGTVTVEAVPSEEGLEFWVEDTGIGLTPRQLEWIRIPFAQVDGGVTRRSSGIGLGLPLAHRLVQAAGGRLKISGEADRGVKVSFTVRACRKEA